MIAGPHNPDGELVLVAWLRARGNGITAEQVATTLPSDVSKWRAEGFLTVTAVSRAAEANLGQLRHGYAQVDAWGAPPLIEGGAPGKPPWHLAWRLAELAKAAADAGPNGGPVALPASYRPARVLSVYAATEPEKITDDPSGFAHVRLDLAYEWVLA